MQLREHLHVEVKRTQKGLAWGTRHFWAESQVGKVEQSGRRWRCCYSGRTGSAIALDDAVRQLADSIERAVRKSKWDP